MYMSFCDPKNIYVFFIVNVKSKWSLVVPTMELCNFSATSQIIEHYLVYPLCPNICILSDLGEVNAITVYVAIY